VSSFYGYQTKWFGFDRQFKVFVRSAGIAGCYVGGQMISRRDFENPEEFAQPELLNQYLGDHVLIGANTSTDRRNIWISREQIEEVQFDDSGSVWVSYTTNSGSVKLHMHNGKQLRLILLGRQDQQAIRQIFVTAGYTVS